VPSLPIDRPGKIVAVGLNYRDHAGEATVAPPTSPILFAKWSTCLVAAGEPIVIPRGIDEVDWEAELAVIIGRRASNVSVDDALDFVSGYTCMNDVSARRAQREDGQWTRAKSFDTFGPIGPRVVPAADIPDPQVLSIRARVNGETITLEPGDVITTGTPSGVGAFRPTPIFLQPGDVVDIEIEGIGILSNPVVGG
jgi:2,4-diketo-3-deoxy-L-fuconate hydrolase